MAVRIYTDKDAELDWLNGKTCAVIGFGAQGRAHALSLRDRGIPVFVGLYRKSESRVIARRNGLAVFDTPEAVRRGDVIFLALPNTKMPAAYKNEIASNLRSGQTCSSRTALRFETLVRAGYPPELAYFECLHELKFIVDLIHRGRNQRDTLSDFGNGEVRRINHWPENYRRKSAEKNGSRVARNSLREICARIYSRNENQSKALREVTAHR
jgi:ketol-acid reductoisomerase